MAKRTQRNASPRGKTPVVTATLVGAFKVVVRGVDLSLAGKAFWRTAMERYGDALQERIAESFAGERVAGSSTLGANTPEWNMYKARKGLDPRRGHATNNLQRALSARRLFRVGAVTNNTVSLEFLESRLHADVPYAEYYEEAKVRRDGILALARKWVQEHLAIIRAEVVALELKQRRAASFRDRPQYIRPTVGLTRAFLRKIV